MINKFVKNLESGIDNIRNRGSLSIIEVEAECEYELITQETFKVLADEVSYAMLSNRVNIFRLGLRIDSNRLYDLPDDIWYNIPLRGKKINNIPTVFVHIDDYRNVVNQVLKESDSEVICNQCGPMSKQIIKATSVAQRRDMYDLLCQNSCIYPLFRSQKVELLFVQQRTNDGIDDVLHRKEIDEELEKSSVSKFHVDGGAGLAVFLTSYEGNAMRYLN